MIKILRKCHSAVWLLIVLGGPCATLILFVTHFHKSALVTAFGTVLVSVFYHNFSKWLFGLRRHVTHFMKRSVDQLTFVDKQLTKNRLVDVVRALQKHAELQAAARSYAVPTGIDLKKLRSHNPFIEPVVWRTVDIDGGNLVNIPENAVFLLTVDGQPVVAKATFETGHQELSEGEFVPTPNRLQLCAHSIEHANTLMKWLLRESSKQSIFRGQVLQVHSPVGQNSTNTVQIVDRPHAVRNDVVLPEGVITLAESLILRRVKHRQHLAAFGHSSRLGLLFYGPPGTGKTLVIKLLLSKIPDHTVVIPTDLAPETLRECFRLAAYLQPTAVVIEDVDLLATNRTEAFGRLDGLQELMNEMDGLSSVSDILVILTTNRPDVLEPALASRPGRVSQAIEFTLPDHESRVRLFQLFLGDSIKRTSDDGGQQTESVELQAWAERTHRASPAFLQELCKRAILIACDRATNSQVSVTDEDLREAMHQLVITGGQLNTNVLGFPDAQLQS